MWLVVKHSVDLFCALEADGEPAGKLTHLQRIGPGELIFGMAGGERAVHTIFLQKGL